jgi:hypothetical protein
MPTALAPGGASVPVGVIVTGFCDAKLVRTMPLALDVE